MQSQRLYAEISPFRPRSDVSGGRLHIRITIPACFITFCKGERIPILGELNVAYSRPYRTAHGVGTATEDAGGRGRRKSSGIAARSTSILRSGNKQNREISGHLARRSEREQKAELTYIQIMMIVLVRMLHALRSTRA